MPFNRPGLAGREYELVAEAVKGGYISGGGRYSKAVESLLEEVLGVPRVLLTTSCTHALELAALLLGIEPGDEVVVPSFTFVSTANAFALRGARIVFADIRRDTLNLDESRLESLLTDKTKAIVPVHYAAVGCEMSAISELARSRGIRVVEDNAHGLFATYAGRYLGTFGSLATLSFHETKNFTCGEGGALLVNDPGLVASAEVIREKGTDRSRFLRGQVDKYTWRSLGSSYLPSDLLAAFLLAQLEQREKIHAARRRVWERYDTALRSWASERGIGTPHVPEHCEQSFHMYYLLLPEPAQRDRLIAGLAERSILAVFHYLPLHLSEMGKRYGGREGDCPVTEDVCDRLVRLPFYTGLGAADQQLVIAAVREIVDADMA